MSSQTPNINLTLPTGAENVSRQIINDNNTKIDTAIGTLNSNKTTIKNYTTLLTSLDSIEVNSEGLAYMSSSINPLTIDAYLPYICAGNPNTNTRTLIVTRGSTNQTYINSCLNGVWQGWKEVGIQEFNVMNGGGNGATTDALLIDTTNIAGNANKPIRINSDSSNRPSDCAFGIRQVICQNIIANQFYALIYGFNNSNVFTIWANFYNGTSWSGWKKSTFS